jgi:hypothetical protein
VTSSARRRRRGTCGRCRGPSIVPAGCCAPRARAGAEERRHRTVDAHLLGQRRAAPAEVDPGLRCSAGVDAVARGERAKFRRGERARCPCSERTRNAKASAGAAARVGSGRP